MGGCDGLGRGRGLPGSPYVDELDTDCGVRCLADKKCAEYSFDMRFLECTLFEKGCQATPYDPRGQTAWFTCNKGKL